MIGLPFFIMITSWTICWLDLAPFVLHFLSTLS
ncbi:hypothetical protein FOPG_17287 [Fusarium oxysporum f. sp. conglutinans race 2 54008]|uniref:Uncharacterized protein n=1 Tax=Fusarium oxysporum f. sp. conglutinans race 2 54008 TaxID=1089457 RepID=X0GSD9_FUSOX|nr:hypothetical protein FOPG_17287 [Fusarium oxysporum f. sp. conglutinans race 2 54008]